MQVFGRGLDYVGGVSCCSIGTFSRARAQSILIPLIEKSSSNCNHVERLLLTPYPYMLLININNAHYSCHPPKYQNPFPAVVFSLRVQMKETEAHAAIILATVLDPLQDSRILDLAPRASQSSKYIR